jgi:hypothetical protein
VSANETVRRHHPPHQGSIGSDCSQRELQREDNADTRRWDQRRSTGECDDRGVGAFKLSAFKKKYGWGLSELIKLVSFLCIQG